MRVRTVRPVSIIKEEIASKGIVLMQKPAPTDFPVHELIRERWSPRAFADKPVPQKVLRSIFEAARWAPSSSNEQPWAYIVATRDDKDNFEKMLSVLVEFNANWAKSAPVLAIAVAAVAGIGEGAPAAWPYIAAGLIAAAIVWLQPKTAHAA